ncbi:antA/AntB antirepressor family protein [Enterobacter roggenkampii]|uniref:antA/AntB antirepressor family protein n=1 Tax=Enterobacter roggenkampii TaxID=1812935 RepID=UPI002B20B0CB|nr:antA/AntB antirepressor family protein [Enterobacter roggenkampii]MEA5196677.1 antA/AntB antirepressor family protein [Enterobacter roggenkampii]
MTIEKSRFSSEATPQPNVNTGEYSTNDFAAIVPVISGQIGGREASIVSAKALHKALGVGNDFSTWIKLRIDEYGFSLSADYVVFDSSDFRNQSSNFEQGSPGWATKRGGDRRSKDYGLSLGMAKELAMVERNEQGRAVRRYFIQCEEALQRSVPEIAAQYRRQLKARIGAANLFKPMCAALESARAEQGKQTQQRHYSNESNMIARIVLGGMTAKQWAQENGITGEPRDSMNAAQLEHLAYLESTNITLIELGQDYQKRKDELMRLSQRWLAKRMGVSHA